MPQDPTDLDTRFAALADPTRRALVERLGRGPATVSELAAPFDMSLVAVSKHLAVLERAGLIERTKIGRATVCRLHQGGLRPVVDWLTRYQKFWEASLDRLAALLDEEDEG